VIEVMKRSVGSVWIEIEIEVVLLIMERCI
jgi:hypothetical protein